MYVDALARMHMLLRQAERLRQADRARQGHPAKGVRDQGLRCRTTARLRGKIRGVLVAAMRYLRAAIGYLRGAVAQLRGQVL